ncbi:MAG: fibro-slime domain-containing protein [Deltaproteobacteria bacterium]|nr:fibro-slime domain-containing protein [Deltaproteobacteria bacterium]
MLGTEACDDGNLKNGDGCNDNCEVEAGFTCLQRPCKEGGNCPQRIDLDVIYRDFAAGSVTDPDFGQPSCRTLTKGLVANELDSNWKPVYAGPAYGCIEELNKWYTRQSAKTTQLKLYADGEGGYVNRYGENGEQWYGYAPDPHSELGEPLAAETWQGQGGTRYVDCKAYGCVICPWDTTGDPQGCVPPDYGYDGNPLFFPLDDLLPTAACTLENSVIDMNHEDACAKIPARYGYTGWPWEAMWSDDAHTHNFYFTSEIIFWFVYEPNKQATLSFTGDDDVWVFVNGQLAIDLGGVHVPETGSVRLTNAADPNPADSNDYGSFGMITGGVYPIHLFHTDRMVEGSSFKLHIRDFTLPNLFPSECHSVK